MNIQELWACEREILDVFDEVCRRNGLRYALAGGTLIGAIRHKGFIPWDDDIDVKMPRPDYNRLIEIWQRQAPEGYLVQTYDTADDSPNNFLKIRKDHTAFIQTDDERAKRYHKGVFIDIMPGDRVAGDPVSRKLQYFASAVNLLYARNYDSGASGLQGLFERTLLLAPRRLKIKLRKAAERFIGLWNDTDHDFFFTDRIESCSRILPGDYFDDPVEVSFEGRKYLTTRLYDKVLRIEYGDYMQLPPEADRVWKHHPVLVDFEHNYEELKAPVTPGRVSVLMGIYNCADTLAEAVACIRAQTYPDWELLLCDDGSTDDTYETAQKLAENDARVRLFRHSRNLGLSAALNTCLAEASGEFVARMDGDDRCRADRFEKQTAYLNAHPDCAVVSSAMDCFDENGVWRTVRNTPDPAPEDVVTGSPICHAPAMMRKAALEAVGGYTVDPAVLRVEDVDLWIKLYAKGCTCHNLPEPLYQMRNDRDAVNRRKYLYRVNSVRVRLNGCRQLRLGAAAYAKAIKPMLIGLVPANARHVYRKYESRLKSAARLPFRKAKQGGSA